MPGLYDNEEGRYVPSPELENGEWFEDEDGLLYIVPENAENDGPDNAIMDEINAICREGRRLNDHDLDRLGLVRIQDFLKRFDSRSGYYHA